jgi:outer membrane protein OmpA-like peptidoglycan-associated protein
MRFLATLFFVLGAADLVLVDAYVGPDALAGRAGGAEGARGRPAASAPASDTLAAPTAPTPMPVPRALPAPPPPRPLVAAGDAAPEPVRASAPARERDPDPRDHQEHADALPHRVTVHFDLDSDELGESGRASLDRTADLLEERDELAVEIDGHADESGSDEYNQDLSERRAGAVADYLEERGVDPARLDLRAFGESEPLSGASERSRKNRRVVIRFSSRAAKGDTEP